MIQKACLIITWLNVLIACINAHGYLKVPPNRASAWREDPIRFPPYYQDNGLFCGDSPIMMNSVNRNKEILIFLEKNYFLIIF